MRYRLHHFHESCPDHGVAGNKHDADGTGSRAQEYLSRDSCMSGSCSEDVEEESFGRRVLAASVAANQKPLRRGRRSESKKRETGITSREFRVEAPHLRLRVDA